MAGTIGLSTDVIMAPGGENTVKELDLYDDFLINEEKDRYTRQAAQQQLCQDLGKENKELKIRIENLEQELESLKKTNSTLKRNISILYKTAKLELERKNVFLHDLQERYDSLVFRRRGGIHVREVSRSQEHFASTTSNIASANSTKPAVPLDRIIPKTVTTNVEDQIMDSKPQQVQQCSSHGKEDSVSLCESLCVENKMSAFNDSSVTNALNVKSIVCSSTTDSVKETAPMCTADKKSISSGILNAISLDSLLKITKLCNLNRHCSKSKKPNLADTERVLAQQRYSSRTIKKRGSSKKDDDADQECIRCVSYPSDSEHHSISNVRRREALKPLLSESQTFDMKLVKYSPRKNIFDSSTKSSGNCEKDGISSSVKLGHKMLRLSADIQRNDGKHSEIGVEALMKTEISHQPNNNLQEETSIDLTKVNLKSTASSAHDSGINHESLPRACPLLSTLPDEVSGDKFESSRSLLSSTVIKKDNALTLLNIGNVSSATENKNTTFEDVNSSTSDTNCTKSSVELPGGDQCVNNVLSFVHSSHETASTPCSEYHCRSDNFNIECQAFLDENIGNEVKNKMMQSASQIRKDKWPDDTSEKSSFDSKEHSSHEKALSVAMKYSGQPKVISEIEHANSHGSDNQCQSRRRTVHLSNEVVLKETGNEVSSASTDYICRSHKFDSKCQASFDTTIGSEVKNQTMQGTVQQRNEKCPHSTSEKSGSSQKKHIPHKREGISHKKAISAIVKHSDQSKVSSISNKKNSHKTASLDGYTSKDYLDSTNKKKYLSKELEYKNVQVALQISSDKCPDDTSEKSSSSRRKQPLSEIEKIDNEKMMSDNVQQCDQQKLPSVSTKRKYQDIFSLDANISPDNLNSKNKKKCLSPKHGKLQKFHHKVGSRYTATDDQSSPMSHANLKKTSVSCTSEKRSSSSKRSNASFDKFFLNPSTTKNLNKSHIRKPQYDCSSVLNDHRNNFLKKQSHSSHGYRATGCNRKSTDFLNHTSRFSSSQEHKSCDQVTVSKTNHLITCRQPDLVSEAKLVSSGINNSIKKKLSECNRNEICEPVSLQRTTKDELRCEGTELSLLETESIARKKQQYSPNDSDYEEGEIRSDEEVRPERSKIVIHCEALRKNDYHLNEKRYKKHFPRDRLKSSKPNKYVKFQSERSSRHHK